MKKQFTLSLVLILAFTFAFSSPIKYPLGSLEDGYYVTVGVYAKSKEAYAQRYLKTVKDLGYDADYGFSEKRNYYYVYTLFTQNYKEALGAAKALRQKEGFSEAWVYVHTDGSNNKQPKTSPHQKSEMKPEAKEGTEEIKSTTVKKETDKAIEKDLQDIAKVIAEEKVAEEEMDSTKVEPLQVEVAESVDKNTKVKEEEKYPEKADKIQFNLLNDRDKEPIKGEVQIIDTERSKLLAALKTGEVVEVRDPNNGTGNLTIIADNFGHRKSQMEFNYYNPDVQDSHVRKEDDHYVVEFDLIRYHVGDIATMYNVYFFKDAAIMRPESKYEVNSLLQMMNDNEQYVIKIHGHTNGKSAGKIISMGESDNFYGLDERNKEGVGSAKKLSEERAEVVRQFLITNGIAPERMEVKGWGGKEMIYEKLSNNAKHNVRVEIEILKE